MLYALGQLQNHAFGPVWSRNNYFWFDLIVFIKKITKINFKKKKLKLNRSQFKSTGFNLV
jgi:hypothetical protein